VFEGHWGQAELSGVPIKKVGCVKSPGAVAGARDSGELCLMVKEHVVSKCRITVKRIILHCVLCRVESAVIHCILSFVVDRII
jgi:hypothetical protein